ncbi:unnamed protein product [Vitrella brassicaformis CCMP3155]|uniref:Uncharacterized protein n=1 Tax=Vitrella brassicaformis (strain CCMP3155) TaxID=1169540 RepID=A0A0G4EVD1_VITBC|nr:unnamed protein product [Vitrella brassicaformis CCMP3155]|eukprot:CEM02356.1 unnamed protein product [Vitrella brassicaformis CCMP3155]
MHTNSAGRQSLAYECCMTDDEYARVKEEIDVLNPQYSPDMQRTIDMPFPGYCEEVEGPLVELADGTLESETCVTLRSQLEPVAPTDCCPCCGADKKGSSGGGPVMMR